MSVSVGLIKVPVADLDRAATFYRELLGLEEQFAMGEYGWAQYATGTVPLCLFVPGKGGGTRAPGGDSGVHLRVGDVRAAIEVLRQRGAVLASELIESDDGGLWFDICDPDGNRIKVQQG